MQEPPSLSQLLRERYLVEARSQQHNEMNCSDSSSSRLQMYGSLKSKMEDSLGHSDPQFPDLSAFLSQEELDKSVNLACQAIGHGPQEERTDRKASITPLSPSNISPALDSSYEPPYVPLTSHCPTSLAGPATVPSTQLVPEYEDLPLTCENFASDGKVLKVSTRPDNIISNSRDSREGLNDFNRPVRNAPYGLETQSKKEFLNKAADFIEELSSLFKANSSKRVRPRACKTYRSKNQSKGKDDETVFPLGHDNRERSVTPVEEKKDRPSRFVSHQPKVQLDSRVGHREFKDCRMETYNCDTFPQEVEMEADSLALAETPHPADPVCEPPFFIQKLKSREVPEGSKVQLDCIVKGLPVPEVRWFCEGKELENSPDIQIITNGNLHSMIIAEAFEEDTGRYSCFASNFYGTDSTSAEIYVEGASSSDSEGEQHFGQVALLQRTNVSTTSNQTLSEKEASPSTHPASATERLSEQLSSSAITQITAEPSQTAATRHLVPEPSETLVASRALLPQEEKTVLPVLAFPDPSLVDKEPSRAQEVSTSIPVKYTTSQVLTTAPTAVSLPLTSMVSSVLPVSSAQTPQPKGLQELLASEGQLVVLECRVKGLPSPQVDWYRDGKVIQDSPDFRILQKKPRSLADSEEICTLVIAEVFPEDSGSFTCVASNKYGTIKSTASLKVTASASNHRSPFSSFTVECSQIQEPSHSTANANLQPNVNMSNSIKPPPRNALLDTLLPEPFKSGSIDPSSSSMLSQGPLCTSLPSVDHTSLSSSSSLDGGTTNPAPLNFLQGPAECSRTCPGSESSSQLLSNNKHCSSPCAAGTSTEQKVSRSSMIIDANYKIKGNAIHQNPSPIVLPLPDPPPNSCLKTGTPSNHRESRAASRVGLRVHFKLPEDEQSEGSGHSDEDAPQMSVSKEPPPVLAKPKLDQAQLQLLHNQVLLEQQQETEHQPQTQPPLQVRIQPDIQSSSEGVLQSPGMQHEPHQQPFQPYLNTQHPNPAPQKQTPSSSSPLANTPSAPSLSSGPALKNTVSNLFSILPSSPLSSPPSTSQPKTFSLATPPLSAPQLEIAPPPRTQMNTLYASNLSLSPAALEVPSTTTQYFSPPALKLVSTDSTTYLQQITSPILQKSTHTSLSNLTATSQAFNYARPKEFIAAQTFSPVRSPSPNESPVPLLQELAAELNSSAASSPTLPVSPPPRIIPMRVLRSPTSPASLMSSPPPGSAPFLNNIFTVPAQLPLKASSPTSSSSTPSPIQNPVAFLSSVLPSLTPSQPTNSMGLPRGAPIGLQKKVSKIRLPSSEDFHERREAAPPNFEKKVGSFQSSKEDTPNLPLQQKLNYEWKTGSRPSGPNIPATVFNFDEEYRISSFEQRLMSEIEFRLERTPVQESDDEVQHDDVPTGKCIAPIFEKKLKNYKAMEGVPVTFSCKVVGIPVPKIYWFKDGVQVLRNNVHYKKIREGDGTCTLHIESATNDDDGNYTVMAANPQGRISCSGHLIVQTGPPRNRMIPVHPQRVRARIQEVEGEQTQERFLQPHFLQAPGDMLAHEGGLCRLDCKVSGLPTPELMWLVNGRPVYPDLSHKMLVRENGIHSLVIDPLTQNDTGTYTCIASNKAGQSSFSLELKVLEKEMKHPPQFVEKLQNMGIPDGSPVRLECRVVGMPPPVIFWKKDNETVSKTTDRVIMSQDETGYVCLLIQRTTKDDAGWYTVSAKNEAGIVACTCRLDIYAQWHQSIPVPQRKSALTGSRYAALTALGIDIKSACPTPESGPIVFSSSPPEAKVESEEL
ncbi:myopalladin isoform X2 [Cheilinus undulatus]|uniref:myopalladin isoform X2 n=1 Tax=Cheilinus undulatus TaxID=241271 RepID=UPI001BD27F3E|nr:myopalladin isoform X2 [Cheilinus undulatus]